MLRELPIRLVMYDLHVARDVSTRLEGVARWAPDGDPLPGLGRLAGGDMPEVREDVAVVAKCTHPGMLRHLPLTAEQTAAVRTIVLQQKNHCFTKTASTLFLTIPLH